MLKQYLLVVLCSLIAIYIIAYFFQGSFIYFPSKEIPDRRIYHAQDMQEVVLQTSDKVKLNAWYKPATENKPTILYMHGNAGNIGNRMYLIRFFLSEGYGVLIFDYRGYGGNKGTPTEQGLYKDAQAALTFLLEQNLQLNQIVFYGESLGTGVATEMALRNPACSLILQSPYTSFTKLARYHYPWILIPPRDKYDSISRIPKINIPTLFLHGEKDTVVPYAQGQELFSKANEPKQWVGFSDRGHGDLWDGQFTAVIDQFIKSHCALGSYDN